MGVRVKVSKFDRQSCGALDFFLELFDIQSVHTDNVDKSLKLNQHNAEIWKVEIFHFFSIVQWTSVFDDPRLTIHHTTHKLIHQS